MPQDNIDIKLSSREKQIIQLVAQGLGCKQIAQHLGISDSTVITYKNRLREKYEAKNCAELYIKPPNSESFDFVLKNED